MAAEQQQVIIGLHFYQPPREAYHGVFASVSTDPQGVDWTARIAEECYTPLAQMGVLPRVSFDVYGTLDTVLRRISPKAVAEMDINMAKNGVADSYVHALLPDRSKKDKQIVIGAGYKRFKDITGESPRFFWPPEAAIDTETLEVLAEYDFKGFFCSPDQIVLNDGRNANNMPTQMSLPSGRDILALSYDRNLSRQLAFDDDHDNPLRADAYRFVDQVVLPALSKLRNGFPLAGYTDGETFGHHMRWGGDFINTLVNRALPEHDIQVVSINEVDFSKVTIAEGKIWDRSAWSCGHGDLARWHGRCNCSGTQEGWKEPFNTAFNVLDKGITRIVAGELGNSYVEMMTDHFDQAFKNFGPPFTTPELSLISSKVSSLTAQTSCSTFFGDPHVSGEINVLHARVAVEHLKDAGLPGRAKVLWGTFMDLMEKVADPTQPGRSGHDMVVGLLGDRGYC